MKYDLSVIVPFYKNSKTIEKCINSILNNQINIEIIIINDGDNYDLKNIAKNNIRIINLDKNHGVSYARNQGLKNVRGKYFAFVDADDYVKKDAYDKVFALAEKQSLDVCGFNYYEVGKRILKSKYSYHNMLLIKNEIIKATLLDEVSLTVWDKIYKTSTFNDVLFDETLAINEDYLYSLTVLSKAKKVLFINDYLYNYCFHYNSLTQNYECKIIQDNNFITKIDNKLLSKLKCFQEYSFFEKNSTLKLLHQYSFCQDRTNRENYINKNIDRQNLKELLKYNISCLKKFEIIIFLVSTKLHLRLFPIYLKIRTIVRGR